MISITASEIEERIEKSKEPIINIIMRNRNRGMNFPFHKCGLYLTHNEHKDYYQKVEDWIKEVDYDWKDEESKMRAIYNDEVWTLHWYPDTPIGSYAVAAPTLEELLEQANEVI